MTLSQSSTQSGPPSSKQPATTPITVSRRYPGAPLVGVGVAIYNAEGQVLLVQSGKASRAGTWGLPGGLIDLGEKLVDAATREVMEETGLTVAIGSLVTTFEPLVRDAEGKIEYHYVVLEYWAHYLGGEPFPQDDVVAAAWAHPAELTTYFLTPEQLAVLEKTYAAWRAAPPASALPASRQQNSQTLANQ